MLQTFTDKMLIDEQQGFLMIFFGRPEIGQIDVESLVPYLGNRARIEKGLTIDGFHFTDLIDASSNRSVLMTCQHLDGYTMIRSHFRPIQLSCLLKDVPGETRATIKAALKGHLPDYTNLLEAWAENAPYAPDDQAREILDGVPGLSGIKPANFTARKAFNIMQAEYGISHIRADRPVLASMGASYCVILSVYNPRNTQGLLTHLDERNNADIISTEIFHLRKTVDDPLVAHMIGGSSSSHWLVADIVLRLREQPNIHLAGWRDGGPRMEAMALDTRTGDVSTSFSEDQVDPGPYVDRRTTRIGSAFGGWRDPRPYCIYDWRYGGYGTIRLK